MSASNNIFLALLKALHISHTQRYTIGAYENHPYKNSFYGLKMLCESYGIEAEGIRLADKNEIIKLSVPFIVDYKDEHVLVRKVDAHLISFVMYGKNLTMPLEHFKEEWGGHALLFYPSENSSEPEYIKHRYGDLISIIERVMCVICGIILLVSGLSQRNSVSLFDVFMLVLNILGIGLTIMLLLQQIKMPVRLVENICHAFGRNDCNKVLESKVAKVFHRYSWAEIGFSFFGVNFLYIWLSSQYTGVLSYIAIVALFYSVWSVCYQIYIAHWCPLCLMVQAVVTVQFLLFLLAGCYAHPMAVSLEEVFVLVSAYTVTLLTVNMLLTVFAKSEKMQQVQWRYNNLKMNDKVFNSLLEAERSYPPSGSSILFGDENSDMKITVLSNPYCNPCAAMHKRLETLIKRRCCIQYVFTSFSEEMSATNKYLIAAYYTLGAQSTWSLLSQWYNGGKKQDVKFFHRLNLVINNEQVEKEFKIHSNWVEQTNLHSTPTVLVNGRSFPNLYQVEDMTYFVDNQ